MNFPLSIFKSKLKEPKTIFIVEDNPVFAKILKTFLISKFSDVKDIVIFPVGEICLMELHRNPAAIIIDYFLDTKYDDAETGLETIQQIKAQKSSANIILLSARKKEEIPLETIKNYNCHYVEKNEQAFSNVEHLIRQAW